MKIAIDARLMGPENTRGIGRYIEELVRALLDADTSTEYVLVTRSAEHPFRNDPRVRTVATKIPDQPRVKAVVADIPWYGWAEQVKLPRILSGLGVDLVHVPHWNVPLAFSRPFVITLHDVLLRHEPESAKASTRGPLMRGLKHLGYRAVLRHAVSAARRILVPTQCVAADVVHFYPGAKNKLLVTGEGMPKIKVESRAPDQLPAPYILYVGSAYPHKGLQDLFAAWPELAERHSGLRLVVVGELDIFMQRFKSQTERAGLPRVEFRGRVDEIQLAQAYAEATALVFPSHFEGFGLPPLEALAHGCPVVCSDICALKEVLGQGGANFFRAGSADGIIAAVERVFVDPAKAAAEARVAAQRLAARHAWKRTAQLTLEAYVRAAPSSLNR
jgi:glycosyltransferase involved in cell wall biosynthesis